MLILGKTNDDKGSQLEQLTLKLLKQQGYKNCTLNYVSAGGSEIDAHAEFVIPQINNQVTREVICECKAHRSPVAMTDWLKFLGKVFSAELLVGHEVAGVFIALSGVNGNVKGNFDQLRTRRDNLSLIAGDDLLQLLQKLFQLIPLETADLIISRLTHRVVRQLDVAYYDGECYWLVVFSGGPFCLLSATGELVGEKIARPLLELVGKEVEVTEFADLAKEEESLKRISKAQSWSLGQLMINGGELLREELSSKSPFSKDELDAALGPLQRDRIIECDAIKVRICLVDQDGVLFVPVSVYRVMLLQGCAVEVIGCEFYDQYINETLLDSLLELQGSVPLTSAERLCAIEILRISPSALARLSEPIPMITTHRKNESSKSSSEQWDKADRDVLFQTLHEALSHDFRNGDLAQHYFESRVLRELETRTQLRLKTAKGVVVDDVIRERTAIARFDESLGGGLGFVRLLEDVPEPWEPGGMGIGPSDS